MNGSNSDKVNDLLSLIKTAGQYSGLVCSLIEVGQQDVVTHNLGEDLSSFSAVTKHTGRYETG